MEGKISWGHGNTWRLIIQFKHDFISYLAVQKIWYIHCKTMFTCWVSLFCRGFTLGPMTQATLWLLRNKHEMKKIKKNKKIFLATYINHVYSIKVLECHFQILVVSNVVQMHRVCEKISIFLTRVLSFAPKGKTGLVFWKINNFLLATIINIFIKNHFWQGNACFFLNFAEVVIIHKTISPNLAIYENKKLSILLYCWPPTQT